MKYEINQRLVRGLDYYCKTVFEWVTDKLGAQGTVCAGGRYDGLVEQLGGKPTPAVGFAMGVERLILMLETLDLVPDAVLNTLDVYVCALGDGADKAALLLSDRIRTEHDWLRIQTHCGGGSFKSQMKKADKSGARFAILLGESEIAEQQATVKDLSGELDQQTMPQAEVAAWIAQQIN